MDEPYLHLYAQAHPHSEALIVGNREALIRLRDAISASLDYDRPCQVDMMARDSDGYKLNIQCTDLDGLWYYDMPYTDYL